MRKTPILLMLAALLLPGLAPGGDSVATQVHKPLETWGIKTADYQKVEKYWADDDEYKDVPMPDCTKESMKLLCSREDFRKIAWYTRRLFIYAEENARKLPLDHRKAHAEVYQTKCRDEQCLGQQLKRDLYQSLEDSGMGYILEE